MHPQVVGNRARRLRRLEIGHSGVPIPVDVPEGETKIARQFTAGDELELIESRGRLNARMSYVSHHKWVHDTFPEHRLFQWQEKYGAFNVSVSQLDTLFRCIHKQEQHHCNITFQEEFLALLRKHQIEFDDRYLWD